MRWFSIFLEERGDTGRKDREKEAKRQEDIARQNETALNELNQWLAQLVPGSDEYRRLQAEGQSLVQGTAGEGDQQSMIRELGSRLVQEQGARIASGEAATPLEARTNLAFQGLREEAGNAPFEQDVLDLLNGLGVDTPTGEVFSKILSAAQDPNAEFDSTLSEQLALAESQNRASFAQRGLLRSGLEQEGATRAGNELAIREAQAREENRKQRLTEFLNLVNFAEQLRNRGIGIEDALVSLQQGRESKLTDLLLGQTSKAGENLLDLYSNQTGRAEDLRDLASALREAERQRTEQAIGTVAAGATAAIPGVGPIIAPAILAGTQQLSPGGIQTAQQTGQATSQTQSQAGSLTRRPGNDFGDIEELIRSLKGASSLSGSVR